MKPGNATRVALALVLAAGLFLGYANRDALSADALSRSLAGAGVWAPLAFIGFYAAATVLFLPGAVLTLAAGALFGAVPGALYSLVGATLGATLAFVIARYLAADWVARKAGGRLKQLIEGVEAEGWRFVAFVRLAPLFPFNLVNYALGLTRIPLVAYAAASFVCMFPGALAYAWLGHTGREALTGGDGTIRNALFALALLALVAFLPRLVRRYRQAGIRWIDSGSLKGRLEQSDKPLLIDLRDAGDFAGPPRPHPGRAQHSARRTACAPGGTRAVEAAPADVGLQNPQAFANCRRSAQTSGFYRRLYPARRHGTVEPARIPDRA